MKRNLLTILKVYGVTWIILIIWFTIRAYSEGISLLNSYAQLIELLSYKAFLIAIHIIFGILLTLFLIFRYFFRIYSKFGYKTMLFQLFSRCVFPLAIIIFFTKYIMNRNTSDNYNYSWNSTYENDSGFATSKYKIDGKYRGMSVFGLSTNNSEAISELIKNNIEWVAVIPFFHQKDEQTLVMSSPDDIGIWSRRDSLFINTIKILREKGIRVMLKPHLWVSSGWRSNLSLQSKTHWDSWFETYRKNMLHYAEMAAQTDVGLICIGTELKSSIIEQADQWKQLIRDIRQIYKGKLTYAANWDGEFEYIDFWDELDYIGIQAYFPLTRNKSPKLEEIRSGWDTHSHTLKTFSEKHKKPILFTEIGYRSDISSTIKPWEWNTVTNLFFNQKSDEAQQLAYEAMFEEFWYKEWFAGCFIWQWNTRSKKARAQKSMGFSPRYKPAENSMAKWYKKEVVPDTLSTFLKVQN